LKSPTADDSTSFAAEFLLQKPWNGRYVLASTVSAPRPGRCCPLLPSKDNENEQNEFHLSPKTTQNVFLIKATAGEYSP
jgi:hypothetical protein